MNGKFWAGDKALSFRAYSDNAPITQIILATDENAEDAFYAGTEGNSLTVYCPWATQQMADDLLAKAQGFRYQGFEASMAAIPGAAERGDGITVGGVYGMLADRTIYFNPGMNSDISAPYEEEVNHEFQYTSPIQNDFNRKLGQVKASLTVSIDSISAQVLGINGELSKLTVDLSGITSQVSGINGELAKLTIDVSGITSQVNGLESQYTSISQSVNGISTTVSGLNGEVNTIKQDLNGVVYESSLAAGSTTINGGCIKTGQILATYIKLGGFMDLYESLDSTNVAGRFGKTSVSVDGSTYDVCGITSIGDGYLGADGRLFQIATQSIWMAAQTGIILNALNYNAAVAINAAGILFNGTLIHSQSSDRRLKTHINYEKTRNMVAMFDALKPVTFYMKNFKPDDYHAGFIAQDVLEAADSAGLSGILTSKDNRGMYGLNYGEMTAIITAKVQDLDRRLKFLEGLNGNLKAD